MNELTQFRNEIDQFMQFHPQSPLDEAQREAFNGLAYYDFNEALVMVLPVAQFPASEPMVEMETSTGDIRPYRRWGRITFAVDGEPASLTIYSDIYGRNSFCRSAMPPAAPRRTARGDTWIIIGRGCGIWATAVSKSI
jgi:uncharacterized protein (DUF1684 family)